MKIKFKKILLMIMLIALMLTPNKILATKVTSDSICTGCDSKEYNIKGYTGCSQKGKLCIMNASKMHGYIDGDTRLFCVDPTRKHGTSYTASEDYKGNFKTRMNNTYYYNNMVSHLADIQKILSCRTANQDGSAAAQALIWELVSNERNGLPSYVNKILKNKDYKTNSISGFIPIYSRLDSDVKKYYHSTLRCAARYNIIPSFASSSQAYAKPIKLTNYSNGSYSYTFKDSNGVDNNLLKYYIVTSSDGSSVKVSKTNSSITVTSSREIKENAPVLITLKYAKKDDGDYLKDDDMRYYYATSKVNNKYPQALISGSRAGTVSYLKVYTPTKPVEPTPTPTTYNTVSAPNYHLRVKKVDEEGNAIEGVTFKIYSNSSLTQEVATIKTNADGWATYEDIRTIGKYYVKEVSAPDGYVTSDEVKPIDVTSSNRFDLSYAEATSSFVNKYNHLKLSKRTIDENGNQINITDYTESSCKGTYKGPVFSIKKENKSLYFKEISAGKYKIVSSTESGSTEDVKTCNGDFDIIAIPSGCYDITEKEAPDGYTLPSNPTQQVCVVKGQESTATVMYNGVTGVVFNKINENGILISGGKFALQRKINGVYKDLQMKHESGAIYSYVDHEDKHANSDSYIMETDNGVINIKNLPQGEYRFVEKEAPDGYDLIKDKDSKATFTISDKGIAGSNGKNSGNYYQIKLVNKQTKIEGSSDSAELIVTIITGRKVINYVLVIGGLAVLLTILIIIRKKSKK